MRRRPTVRNSRARRNGPPEQGPDPRTIARSLIATLGEQAPCHATYEALKARKRGDWTAMDAWLWIAGATREMLRSDPLCES